MIFLRNVKLVFNKKNVFFGLVLGVASLSVPQYGIYLSAFFFLLSAIFLLFASRLQKSFEAHFEDVMRMSDSFEAVLMDKNGNIKQKRKQ